VWLAGRRIGGYTGDVLGAQCVLAETAGWVVAALVLHHAWRYTGPRYVPCFGQWCGS
jgi:hypothetical protein